MSTGVQTQAQRRSPARFLARGVWLCAAILVAFGGAITTLRAGMAIDGWWVLDRGNGDHFLLAYPLEKWFASSGTFAEHTHRLIGVVVGILSILYVLVRSFERPRSSAKLALAWAGLVAVCAQGAVGGFRVLENSQDLAFLHGALAQLVFALLGVNVVVSAADWDTAPRGSNSATVRHMSVSPRRAWVIAAVVYSQAVVGAWLRHTGAELALTLHLVFAAVAIVAVLALARDLRRGAGVAPLVSRHGRRLQWLVGVQFGLGLITLLAIFVVSGGFTAEVSTLETISATAHVLTGALLLQEVVASAMWLARDARAVSPDRVEPVELAVEVAR